MPDFTPQPIPPFVALPTRSAQLEPQPSAGLFAVNRTGTGLSTPPTSSFTSTGHVQSVVSVPVVQFERLTVSESGAKASLTGESPVPLMPRAHVHLPLTDSVTGADATTRTRSIPVHDPPARHHTVSRAFAHSNDPARIRERVTHLYNGLTADEVAHHELRARNAFLEEQLASLQEQLRRSAQAHPPFVPSQSANAEVGAQHLGRVSLRVQLLQSAPTTGTGSLSGREKIMPKFGAVMGSLLL